MMAARSKIHAQTDFSKDRAQVLQAIADKTYKPTRTATEAVRRSLIASRAQRLTQIAERHRRQGRAALVDQGLKALEQLPAAFTLDDDPSFDGARQIVSGAASLGIPADACPAVGASVNHILRHAYLVTHEPAVALAGALPDLYPAGGTGSSSAPQGDAGASAGSMPLSAAKDDKARRRRFPTADAQFGAQGRLATLAPRLRQLAPEALVSESATVLSSAAKLRSQDRDTFVAFTRNVIEFHENASAHDLCRCLEAVSRASSSADETRDFIAAIGGHLADIADDMSALDVVMVFAAFARADGVSACRRLALAAADRLLVKLSSLTPRQAVDMLRSMAKCEYRHPTLYRRLCNRLVLAAPTLDADVVSRALAVASDCPERLNVDLDVDVVEGLLARLLELPVANIWLEAAHRCVRTLATGVVELDEDTSDAVFDHLLSAVATHAGPRARDDVLVDVITSVAQGGYHRHPRAQSALAAVATEIARRGGLPAADGDRLRRVASAIERMLSDDPQGTLRTALRPLLE